MKEAKSNKISVINLKDSIKNVFTFNAIFYLNMAKNHLTFAFLLFIFAFLLSSPNFAQMEPPKYPRGVVPPPLDFISKSETKQLNAETKTKKRVKLSLELMEIRLTNSKEYIEKNEFQKALNEIGTFRGLLTNTLKFLKSKEGHKSSLKHFKKLELRLRSFLPKLELIRREMPYKYGFHIKRTMIFVKKTRAKALSTFFDDSVISENN